MTVSIQFSIKRYRNYIAGGSSQKTPLYLVDRRKTFNYRNTRHEDSTEGKKLVALVNKNFEVLSTRIPS